MNFGKIHKKNSFVYMLLVFICIGSRYGVQWGKFKITEAAVGRPRKPAKRRNYKITFDLLARLSAIARLEDRSDTAQLERFIREGAERWESENPAKAAQYQELVEEFLEEMDVED